MIMEYQKIINSLDNKPYQPFKSRSKNCVEINDDACGTYNKNSKIKFKTSMLKSSLCDYSEAYILVSGTITIDGAGADDNAKGNERDRTDERDKEVISKNCAPFTDCTSEINNTQIDNAKDLDVVMPMYNLIQYDNNYSKISGSLWQYYKDDANDITKNSESFKFKMKITGKTPADGNTNS